MPAPYSYDLRKKAIEAVKGGHKKINVCRLFEISRNTLDLWLKREQETGDYIAIANKQGRQSKIEDQEKFKLFVKENKDKTQIKMAELWGEGITQQNISYTCQKLGISRKKTYGYQERSEPEREAFRQKISKIPKKRRVYVDEAGFDNRESYPYGYSPRGQRCYALKCGKKRERTSWISALREGKTFAPLTFEGSCNGDLFEAWLSQSLIPQLNPGDIIIVDNATFHKGQSIREIIEDAGCEIWYLPAYSPDLNKIEREMCRGFLGLQNRAVENWWSVLKTWMKQMLPEFETVRECVDAAFKNCPNVFA